MMGKILGGTGQIIPASNIFAIILLVFVLPSCIDRDLRDISIASEMLTLTPMRPELVVAGNTVPRDTLVVFFSDHYLQNALELVDNFKLPRQNITSAVPEKINMYLPEGSTILFSHFRSIRLFLLNEVTDRELIATRDSIPTNAQRSLELNPVRNNLRSVVMSEVHHPIIRAEVIFRNEMTSVDTTYIEVTYKLGGRLE